MRELRDTSKPFFLYVSFHEPHEPIATDPQHQRHYPAGDPSYAAHHGNITQMDAAFGRLMATVDELSLRENTLVLFTSDNGPAQTVFHPNGSTGRLRDKKGYIADGGNPRAGGSFAGRVRRQPGRFSNTPLIGTDILPTFCAIAEVAVPADRVLDGASFLPLFDGLPIERKTPLYWHFYAASGAHKVALRRGDWKLSAELKAVTIRDRGGIHPLDQRAIKTARLGEMELYNLSDDIGETTDLKRSQPALFGELRAMLETQYGQVQRESPIWPAWEFPGYESQRIVWPPYRGARRVTPHAPRIPPVYRNNPDIESIE